MMREFTSFFCKLEEKKSLLISSVALSSTMINFVKLLFGVELLLSCGSVKSDDRELRFHICRIEEKIKACFKLL